MIHPFDHFVVFLFAIALPINSYFGYRRFVARVRRGEAGVRLRQYRTTTLVQWTLAAIAVAAWIVAGRPLASLGLEFPLDLRAGGVTAFCLGIGWLYRRQSVALFQSEVATERLGKQIEPLRELLPNDLRERNAFIALSITAGICEELLFRGFLLWYLSNAMPTYAAVAVSTVVFGLGHAYQGRTGIVKTGVIGLVMSLLYLEGRTLYPLMILHAIIDAVGGLTGYRYLTLRGKGPARVSAGQP